MDEKWNSVFLYQHAGGDAAHQLENNTTKNLLTVLRDTDRSFTNWFLSTGFEAVDWTGFNLESVETQVSLNSDELAESLTDGTEGFLLGISRYGAEVATDEKPARNASSTIDGLLVLRDGDGAERIVGIEVKTYGDKLNPGQMSKYRSRLQIPREKGHRRLGTLTWGTIYEGVTTRAQAQGAGDLPPRELSKDGYLWNEFAKSLRYDQLEIIIAQNDDSPHKRLWMRPDIGESRDYQITVTWENSSNVTKSRLGWMELTAFEDLLTQLPLSVRKAAFGDPDVSYQQFIDALYEIEEYAEIETGINKNLARTTLPDGSDRAFRMKWITDENDDKIVSDVPHFRIVKYYESGRYAQSSSPNLDPRAFEALFESIPVEIRRRALVGNPRPDLSVLWERLIHDENAFTDPR